MRRFELDDRVEHLEDGFERYGSEDSPFLLRGAAELRSEAANHHRNRDREERQRDEQSNEPVTRDIDEWRVRVDELDFPHVDTVPHGTLEERAENALTLVDAIGVVSSVDETADLREAVFGLYLPGVDRIELEIDDPPFLACRRGPVLAHEVGHAVYASLQPDDRTESGVDVFREAAVSRGARRLAERLHGPYEPPASEVEGLRGERREAEQFACVFESMCIEPEAATRIAPETVSRVDRLLGELNPRVRTIVET
jgi:hypothetical protein